MRRLFGVLCALILTLASARAEDVFAGAKRVLFLGDSITYAGHYVSLVELYLYTQEPGRKLEVINAGLSSETVSGLSEEGHADGKFPRPDLHERLTRVLDKVKPDLVFACYGMNDGIYLPLDPDRTAKYQDGIRRLRAEVTKRGARIVHLTPPVFDPTPPAPRATSYDAVLAAYGEWLLAQRKDGWTVIDIHGPMGAAIDARRASDPAFTFSKDRVHPNEDGQAVIADALLAGLAVPKLDDFRKLLAGEWMKGAEGKAYFGKIRQRGRLLIHAWLTETGHRRPGVAKGLPLAEAEAKAAELDQQIRTTAVPR